MKSKKELKAAQVIARQEAIDRLAIALRYYREHKGYDPARWGLELKAVARRFNIHIEVLRKALEMERQLLAKRKK